MNPKITLISVDNAIDDLNIYDRLGCNQHAFLHALLRIFNQLKWIEQAPIANITIEHKSGIPPRTFHRVRQSLLDFKIEADNAESWIVRYIPSSDQKAGMYKINYEYLKTYMTPTPDLHDTYTNATPDLHDTYIGIQKMAKNGNDLRIDQNRSEEIREEALSPTSLTNSDIDDFSEESESELEYKEPEEDRQEWFNEGKKLIESIYPMYFSNNQGGLMNKIKRELIINIGVYYLGFPDMVKECIENVSKRLKNPENLLQWTWEDIQKKRSNGNGNK